MASELSPSARRVQEALAAQGLLGRVVELPQTTCTAVDAARAIGCEVTQIVKTLVFHGARSDQWKCPSCGRRLARRTRSSACGRMSSCA